MFYRVPSDRWEAVLLHDANTLDFLGAVGVARILSITERHRWAPSLPGAIETIARFHAELPDTLVTSAARRQALLRVEEGRRFLDALARESLESRAV